MKHSEAVALLKGRSTKTVGNNTILRALPSGDVAVELHGTAVVTIHADGTYTLRSGGWHTNTTRARMMEFSPASLFLRGGALWFSRGTLFRDGVKINSDGAPLDAAGNVVPYPLEAVQTAR